MRHTSQVLAIVCAAALFGAACSSGGSSKASGPTTTLAPSPATELRSLVAFPPPPFEPVTDAPSVALEVGKPGVKEPSLPFASSQQLSNAGFQRGWESIFGTPDGAVVLVNILQFGTRAGPVAAQKLFLVQGGPAAPHDRGHSRGRRDRPVAEGSCDVLDGVRPRPVPRGAHASAARPTSTITQRS